MRGVSRGDDGGQPSHEVPRLHRAKLDLSIYLPVGSEEGSYDIALIVPEFSLPDHWPRSYGLDIRWNTVAAIWGARDPESDVVYLYSEYLAESDPVVMLPARRSVAHQTGGKPFGLIGHQLAHEHGIVQNADISTFEG